MAQDKLTITTRPIEAGDDKGKFKYVLNGVWQGKTYTNSDSPQSYDSPRQAIWEGQKAFDGKARK